MPRALWKPLIRCVAHHNSHIACDVMWMRCGHRPLMRICELWRDVDFFQLPPPDFCGDDLGVKRRFLLDEPWAVLAPLHRPDRPYDVNVDHPFLTIVAIRNSIANTKWRDSLDCRRRNHKDRKVSAKWSTGLQNTGYAAITRNTICNKCNHLWLPPASKNRPMVERWWIWNQFSARLYAATVPTHVFLTLSVTLTLQQVHTVSNISKSAPIHNVLFVQE